METELEDLIDELLERDGAAGKLPVFFTQMPVFSHLLTLVITFAA